MPAAAHAPALEELARKGDAITTKLAVVGLDGFVDKILHPVLQRQGPGKNFQTFSDLKAFGERIVAAAGKSTSIEIFPIEEKLGGNGPLLASALLRAGAHVRYIGAIGHPKIHPLFQDFAQRTEAVSIAEPGVTHALEFSDGKLMLGMPASLENISLATIVQAIGEGPFFDLLFRADLLSLVNWTMIPHMTALFEDLLARAYPTFDMRPRHFFFDLADPAKRPRDELHNALRVIGRFHNFGNATLGLNLAEAEQCATALGLPVSESSPENLKLLATRIRQTLDLGCVVVHPVNGAACATREGAWWVVGPYCDKPVITTGAGDHFNAGFATGQLLGCSPTTCLTLGVCFSGYYVRQAQSPTLTEVIAFLRAW